MIELSNVTKHFESSVTAVNNLSFTVGEGEIFGLIGTSGCGKTTTLKMINRLEEPSSGSISIEGKSVLNQRPERLRRRIGYVIQNVGLFPHYSVRQNIAITPKLQKWESGRINKRCDELLDLVGLDTDQFANRLPSALSGGQQQRVGLARALAADPPVILMDEPFGALDPITKEKIQYEFKKLLQEIKKTVVLVTHDVFEAFDLCDRICLMNDGKARQTGTPRDLLFKPADDFVHSFFDNHRFQLEMISITIKDILEVLKNESGKSKNPSSKEERFGTASVVSNQGDVQAVSIYDSFFTVFENAQADESYCIKEVSGETTGVISSDNLLDGFQKVRHKLKQERDD